MLRVGLLGFGFVGQGVYEILRTNAAMISDRVGSTIQVTEIVVRDPAKYHSIPLADGIALSSDVDRVLENPDIDIVVELMGGEQPAFDYICRALKSGKRVVTANKEVIAKHKDTFFQLAKTHNTDIYFEAAVGGGIPIIRKFKVGLAANQMQSIYGILNGTTNYILTKIQEERRDFQDVLAQAQELGFAEADPHMDVSGLDAAYKLVILAAVAFKVSIRLEDVVCEEGITEIQLQDIAYADELGYVVKLLAVGRTLDGGHMRFSVLPTLVEKDHPLAMVRNEYNAIYSVGNMVGDSLIYGKGAGGLPTGSAVVSDIVDIAFDRAPDANLAFTRRNLEYDFSSVEVAPRETHESRFYLRVIVDNSPGVLGKIGDTFAASSLNVAQLLQKSASAGSAEIVIITESTTEGNLEDVLASLDGLNVVQSVAARLRLGVTMEQS